METKTFVAAGVVLAILIGVAAVFLASPDPDGLESTALIVQGDKTLTGDTPPDAEVNEDAAGRFSYESPLPDYTMGEEMGKTGEIVALVAGVLVTFLAILAISRLVARPVK
ncbi:MAG: PDGLE domain-containing protein [Methanomicrobiales archaeon]|nr:PDGLE domain-containing protein [Methanomicrobiales archaeon]MDD1659724.1 PDGLE domain-containing protein [Methanomicrobiales archaeon]